MIVTASSELLIVGAILLSAAVFVPLEPERWAAVAGRTLGSDWERIAWLIATNLRLAAPLAAFARFATLRAALTGGSQLQPAWRDYLTVALIAAATLALRWLWAVALRRAFADRLAMRAVRRWRDQQPPLHEESP